MYTVRRTEEAGSDPAQIEVRAGVADRESAILQNVATGDVLYQAGDKRQLYRVEQGAVCHYIRWTDGSHEVIEVAFPGDIIGLGHLSRHVSTAQAMVDTVVSVLSEDEFERASATDDRLSFLLAGAGEREFNYMRDATLNSGKRAPVERLACYLLAIANSNVPEGRDEAVISDEVSSGYVAERLQMSLDTLSAALVGLEKKGLVASTDEGLRITDLPELEKLANAA